MASRAQSQDRVKARQEAAAKLRARRAREDKLVADALLAVQRRNVARKALDDATAKVGDALAAVVDLGLSTADVADLVEVVESEVKASRRPKANGKRASRETDLVAGVGGSDPKLV